VNRVLLVEPFLGDGLRPGCSASRSQDDVVLPGERGDHPDADACRLGDVADGWAWLDEALATVGATVLGHRGKNQRERDRITLGYPELKPYPKSPDS